MRDWHQTYPQDISPTPEQISAFVRTPLWEELTAFLQTLTPSVPRMEYSKCTMAPGWNIKFTKKGRSLCTLYPKEGFFSCMVVIGMRELPQAQLLLPHCTTYTQEVYTRTKDKQGAAWLMLDITEESILQDAKNLILLR